MATFTMSRDIAAPQQRVFEVFTDLERAPDRVDGIKKLELLTEGPVGEGTRFRETRVMFNKEATEEMEIADFHPGKSYAVLAESCGCAFRTEFQFTPKGEGTRVEMHFESKALTFMAKLMAPLSFLMMGTMKKCMLADMDDLTAVAESGESEPTKANS